MIYLDANIFLSAIVNPPADEQSKICNKILMKIVSKELLATTSFLTWDEVVFIIKKTLGKNIASVEGKKFLCFPNLTFLNINQEVILLAQDLLTKYDLNPRDAIHAASALFNNIDEIISDDSDFDQIKEIKRIKPEKFK